MNNSLVIDTSTNRTLVGIVSEGTLLFEAHHDDALGHGEALPKLVQQALAITAQIDSVIVGMGPGPFTGLRVGISFAQSFAFARGLPWVGVCGLDAIASQISDSEFFVTIDARRKEVFFASIKLGSGLLNQVSANHHNLQKLRSQHMAKLRVNFLVH
jgi:tRNA threonylcarbamoyl adenosine modification protein YeaZ